MRPTSGQIVPPSSPSGINHANAHLRTVRAIIGREPTRRQPLSSEPTFVDGAPAPTAPATLPGLPARYRDLGRIATGGTAEVRRVEDTRLARPLAIKILHPDLLDDPAARARFAAEARTTAGLQHPGIVAVHDEGTLADGRPWFTMRVIDGETLTARLAALDPLAPLDRGAPERDLLDGLLRVAEALAYAHQRGVVHRDLKPDNLMIGPFGEVLVMDWGLASADAHLTAGTPGYLAPEQATPGAPVGPPADVHALGALLYRISTGAPPYPGRAAAALRAVRRGPPPPLADRRPDLPADLAAVADRALARDPAERHPDAAAFAADLRDALRGARRRAEAEALLARAHALEPQIAAADAAAERHAAAARAALDAVPHNAPAAAKRAAWAAQDTAAAHRTDAAVLRARWLQDVRAALERFDLPAARAALARHHLDRLVAAEARHDAPAAAREEALLAPYAAHVAPAVLRGEGALTLVTDPPARARLSRYTARDRRLVAEPVRDLGTTPIRALDLPRGSYLVELRAPGHAPLRYPVHIERGGHWQGIRPGDDDSTPIPLVPSHAIGDGIPVAPGWCLLGGDPDATESLPRRRVWLDGFTITRDAITLGEWLTFLDAADPMLAARCLPRTTDTPLIERAPDGRHRLLPAEGGRMPSLDWPVSSVDWHAATAYAAWRAARDALPWRLPAELEWEKAARGVDARAYPWGDHLEPTWARVVDTDPRALHRVAVDAHPDDLSPYGVRGLAGNVRDWCLDVWREDGPPLTDGLHRITPADPADPALRAIRGGAWSSAARQVRAASRFAAPPGAAYGAVGLRLARPWHLKGSPAA